MDLIPLLAQEAPTARGVLQRLFANYPPEISVPVFLVGLVVVAWLLERIVVGLLRRMAAKTTTHIDDALVDGLPLVIRPIVAVIALHVIIQQFLRDGSDPTRLSAEGELAQKALMVLSIIVIAVAVTRLTSRMIDAWVSAEPSRVAVGPPIKLAIKVGMVPLAFLAALQAVDYPITSFLTALGIGSLAVGLALQDTLKNMFAGIQIVLDHPIRAGDFVEIDGTAKGTVLEIGLRSTKLRSIDNNVLIIPNATIANATVTNFDYSDRAYVQNFEISVAYGSDTRRVQRLLEEVAVAAQAELPGFGDEPPGVSVKRLGESSIDFTVGMKFRQFIGRGPAMTEMYHRFRERLLAEGIEIPFPTRVVYLRNETPPAATETPPPPEPAPPAPAPTS